MRNTATILLAVGALALTALPSNAAQPPQPTGQPNLASAFQDAAAKYDVPREVLVSVGFAETHLDGHNGTPSQARAAHDPAARACSPDIPIWVSAWISWATRPCPRTPPASVPA